MTENKLRILKRAKKLERRRYRSEQYRNCFHQYNRLEKVSTTQFDSLVSGDKLATNIVDIHANQKKEIQPAMPLETHLHLYKKRLLAAKG